MKKYEESIIMTIGGNSMRAEIRVPESDQIEGLMHMVYVSPVVSAIGSSNPGFSFIELTSKTNTETN